MSKMRNLKRSTDNKLIGVVNNGKVLHAKKDDFFRKLNIQGVIRLQKQDFAHLSSSKNYLTHFNLQRVDFKRGERFALALIVKPGFFDGKKEVLPVMSFKNAVLAECVNVRNNVPYDKLTKEDFKYSFKHIKNVPELKKAILRRYKKSVPHLSKEQILSLGVSITKLKILNYLP